MALVAGLIGCSPERPGTDDPAGALPNPDSEAPWRVSSAPITTIGVREGEAPYQFFDVAAAALRPDGGVVVADARAASVRSYSAEGRWERRLGGSGAGPGEFLRPTDVLVDDRGSVHVWDGDLWRRTSFTEGGAHIGDLSLAGELLSAAAAPPLYPVSARLLPDDEVLIELAEKSQDKAGAGRFRRRAGAMRMPLPDPASGALVASFADVDRVWVDSPWGPLAVTPALARRPVLAVRDDRYHICVGDQAASRVECFDEAGVTVVRWSRPARPVAPGHADVRAWRERAIEEYGQKLSPHEARSLVHAVPLPEARPPFDGLLLDRDGRLWVDLGPLSGDAREGRELLLFDPGGTPLGSLVLPNLRLLDVAHGRLVGVRTDDLGIQSIEVYALETR